MDLNEKAEQPRLEAYREGLRYGRYGQQVRTGVSLFSCLLSVFLSNRPFPHRWTSSLPSVRVQPWAQLVSFSGATQCMRQVW